MVQAIRSRFSELTPAGASSREMQERREAMVEFDRKGADWARASAGAWLKSLTPATAAARKPGSLDLELIGDEVVERKILSSRLAQAIQEKASWELNDLRIRMQYLEGGDELADADVLRPETFSQLLVEQWDSAGMSPESWALIHDVVQRSLTEYVTKALRLTNEFLVGQGIMREIDLSSRVKRGVTASGGKKPDAGAEGQTDVNEAGGGGGSLGGSRSQAGSGGGQGGPGGQGGVQGSAGNGASSESGPMARGQGGVADETRLMTSTPPLARVRMRATGVLGQLKRLLTDRVAGFDAPASHPSPALTEALSQHMTRAEPLDTRSATSTGAGVVYDNAAVQEVAGDLRRRTGELKKKAATSTEKATIEIVALMFQSILAEERIPPAVRVWFARLQMPVLRVALAEPEFFGSLEHPARQLIDRMGSCVMGFDTAAIGVGALEVEIKRVVQVIEQYPETAGVSHPTLVIHNRSGAPGTLKPAEFNRALGSAADCVLECRPKPLIEAATLGEPAIRRCNPLRPKSPVWRRRCSASPPPASPACWPGCSRSGASRGASRHERVLRPQGGYRRRSDRSSSAGRLPAAAGPDRGSGSP